MARSPQPQRRSSLLPFYVILGLVAVVGAVVLFRQLGGSGGAATQPVPVAMNPSQLSQVQGISIGQPNAPVEIFEFADFQCPGCGDFARFVAPVIKDRYVQGGQVRFVYYDFPLTSIHPNAFLAARAGRCANEQDKFWQYHDVLYGQQAGWSAERDPSDDFVSYARQVPGLDQGKFRECLQSDRYAREISENIKLGESLGVNGTPTLFVNGKRLPNVPSARELDQIIQQEMGTGTASAPAAQ